MEKNTFWAQGETENKTTFALAKWKHTSFSCNDMLEFQQCKQISLCGTQCGQNKNPTEVFLQFFFFLV